jgi:hypothetical protein
MQSSNISKTPKSSKRRRSSKDGLSFSKMSSGSKKENNVILTPTQKKYLKISKQQL